MRRSSNNKYTRDAIIGLGEESFKKNYYPELLRKITMLEQLQNRNDTLINAIRDIFFIYDEKAEIKPFSTRRLEPHSLMHPILANAEAMENLKMGAEQALKHASYEITFSLEDKEKIVHLEARFNKTQSDEVIIIVRDISDIVELQKTHSSLLNLDPISKLYNRRWFDSKINEFTKVTAKHMALFILEVTGLQFIKTTLGQIHSEQLIVLAGEIISVFFSENTTIARISFESFAVIIEDISEMETEALAKNFETFMAKHNNSTNTKNVLISYGYAHHSEGIINMETMFVNANSFLHLSTLTQYERAKHFYLTHFVKTIEQKASNREASKHCKKILVNEFSRLLNFTSYKRKKLHQLSRLYDIGEIGLPEHIFQKKETLSEMEWSIVRSHTMIGEKLLTEFPEYKGIANFVLYHHENWDGSGYPYGLFKEAIPLESRIIRIIDSIVAMAHDLPYRKKIACEQLIKELKKGAGKEYDPNLVSLILPFLDKNKELIKTCP